MFKRVILLAGALVLLWAGSSFAGDAVKIGYVDLQRALNESKYGQKVMQEMEDIVKSRRAEIEKMIDGNEKKKQDFQRQAVMMSDEAKREKIAEIEKSEREINRYISDSEEEFKKIQRDKKVGILNDLGEIINLVGKDQSLTVVLPSEAILYSADGVDITEVVIGRYDQMKASASGK